MNSEKKSDKLWEGIEPTAELVANALALAQRDLRTAEHNFKNEDYDWSFAISYNAMLQAGRALMFSKGVRPTGEYKHVSVIEFVKTAFGQQFADNLLYMFNKIRKKRHTAVYEQVNSISPEEARNALKVAKEFLEKVATLIPTK